MVIVFKAARSRASRRNGFSLSSVQDAAIFQKCWMQTKSEKRNGWLGRARHSVRAVVRLDEFRRPRSETASNRRRDELHESPIIRKSPKRSGTRVTRPSEYKALKYSRSGAPHLQL